MKTKISISVLLMILLTSFLTVMGQEKTDKKKQEEEAQKKKEQVTIIVDSKKDSQKDLQKAMEASLAAEEKALKARKDIGIMDNKAFIEQSLALEDYKKKLEQMKSSGENWDTHYNFSFAPPLRYKSGDMNFSGVYNVYGGNGENTTLSISKNLEDVTFATDFFYDVKEESSNVNFYVSGSLKAGELKITLRKPDKTAFQEFTISPLADVNWNQQFSWDEDEAEQYLGKWTISISATKAGGNYRVQVNSR
jgi:hypothetical protein